MIKKYWDHINQIANDNFKFSDSMFKVIILSLLSPAWNTFMEPYVRGQIGIVNNNSKWSLTLSQLIGLIKEKYIWCQNRNNLTNESMHTAYEANYWFQKPLAQCMTMPAVKPKPQGNLFCKHCKLTNHTVDNCCYLNTNSCGSCSKYEHLHKECWKPIGNKCKWDSDNNLLNKGNTNKHFQSNNNKSASNVEQTHLIVFNVVEDPMQFSLADEGQYFNFDSYDVNSADVTMNDEHILYYDWLADSTTMLHICNAREAFIDYESIVPIPVVGVGNIKAHTKGRESVKIQSYCDGHMYTLQLENVLHVPGNSNNLISLGQWDHDECWYEGHNGILMLFTKDGISVARGTKIANHLYKMNFKICKD